MTAPTATAGGDLYVWGFCGIKTNSHFLPVEASALDGEGHCVYPAKVVLPKGAKGTKFVASAADHGVFAAIDTSGGLWAWGGDHSVFGAVPMRLAADAVVSCDVNHKTVVCCTASGDVFFFGGNGISEKSAADTHPIKASVPSGGSPVVSVAACGTTVCAVCADGSVWSMGSGLTNGLGADSDSFKKVEALPPTALVSLGSCHAAAVTLDGRVFVWGDGVQGNLGLGSRQCSPVPLEVVFFRESGLPAVHVACTRGQPTLNKRHCTLKHPVAGEEGPRTHVVTADGGLWIAGTSHKGMGGDHVSKTMQPAHDLLSFYRVGGKAVDTKETPVPTGAAEDIRDPALAATAAARMGMASPDAFGKDGNTGYLTATRIASSQPCHIHSLALSSDGRLFAWGCGSDGRTGLRAFMRGPGGSKRTLKCYVSSPSVVEALEGTQVLCAAGGRYWSMAVVRAAAAAAPAPKEAAS